MFDYINGKKSESALLVFSILWGICKSLSTFVQENIEIANLLVTFLGATIVGGLSALILGKLVSKFTKKEHHVVGVANWFLIIGCGLTLVVATASTSF